MEVLKTVLLLVFHVVFFKFMVAGKPTVEMGVWRQHEKRVHAFACKDPQPRAFPIEAIVEDNELYNINSEFIFPRMTVLHRCDSQSGCCSKLDEICAPQVTEDVDLTFRILQVKGKSVQDRFLHVRASNHTYCSCQTAHDLPK